MKTTIAVALAACVSTQVFAQSKEDVITISLTGARQASVSSSASVANAGLWSANVYTVQPGNQKIPAGPLYYKTGATKVTDQDVIKFIGYVKHKNPTYYSSKAKLVLVQGELSGFFNITPDLGVTTPQNLNATLGTLNGIIDNGSGNGQTQDFDAQTDIPNSQDSAYATLANGHHFLVNGISGEYPVGHNQPWGQIFIKDTGKTGYTVLDPLCENVTYYFAFSVEECYDCFYLSSFVSDAAFAIKTTQQIGPPCCGSPSTIVGKGTDRYYLTLSFDNTVNNPYLNLHSDIYTGDLGVGPNWPATGSPIPGDGIVADTVNNDAFLGSIDEYQDTIRRSPPFPNLAYEARFTLNGIMTYAWNLKFVNTSDLAPDFVGVGHFGTAAAPVNGYGFIGLYCTLLTGTATFTENAVKTVCCLDNGPWYDTYGGWYGPGAEYYETLDENQNVIAEQTAYSYMYNLYGLATTPVTQSFIGPSAPTAYYTPINTGASLTYHHNFDLNYGWSQSNWGAGWPTPGSIDPVGEGSGATYPQVSGWQNFDLNQGL